MAMGRSDKDGQQQPLWVEQSALPKGAGHVFYERLNGILQARGFDAFVEKACTRFYAPKMGRPSLAPGTYFRMLLVGYFERLESERGIAWRCADSLSLRRFLGCRIDEDPADHSTVSRTRRLIDLETHQEVFAWVLSVLATDGLIKGKTVGIDATTLEANAALRSIVRRDTGESYQDFLKGLAKESGIETPTRADLARLDRKRSKKGSNDDWTNPNDPDAQITKMKDGRTHLAHKDEHVVDMETGAILAVSVTGGAAGDTKTIAATLSMADANVARVQQAASAQETPLPRLIEEVVADKGYHSNDVLVMLHSEGYRAYLSEPDRGRRRWEGDTEARDAVYRNRARIRELRGRRLLRRRGELLERPFAHYLDAGGMRRTHLRGNENILKRLLIHVAGFNLGLMLRKLLGKGTPKELSAVLRACLRLIRSVLHAACHAELLMRRPRVASLAPLAPDICFRIPPLRPNTAAFATGC